jgi:5-bromo-4-chloroindolyl phosphate hydrolysis protein
MKREKKMSKKELIACIAGIIGLISICFAVHFWFENRYAHADDMIKAMKVIEKVSTRLDYKILQDQLRDAQRKIYDIEDRYCQDKSKPCNESKMPQTVREQYRELKCEKENLQKELDTMNKPKR